jgi:ectoine hydroxylase-related dioxygenase (phytanoyl-CoA dioxygenase family)
MHLLEEKAARQTQLWTDAPEALQTLAARQEKLKTNPAMLEAFIQQGYTTTKSAVKRADIDEFFREFRWALADPSVEIPMTYWQDGVHHHSVARPERLGFREAKVLDLHVRLPACQRLIFSPVLLEFLTEVFEDEPVAFQTLYFEHGSQQGAHQDSAFVYTDPAAHFVASWIALENIGHGTGELFYFPKSHRLDVRFDNGEKKFDHDDPDSKRYSAALESMAEERGLRKEVFCPHQGQVLFWAADLIHGGQPIVRPRTRRSLVTHYCPKRVAVPYASERSMQARRLASGGWVVAQY